MQQDRNGIRDFALEVGLKSGDRRWYRCRSEGSKAEVAVRDQRGDVTQHDDALALQQNELLLAELALSEDMSEAQLMSHAYRALNASEAQIEYLQIETTFTSGRTLRLKHGKGPEA